MLLCIAWNAFEKGRKNVYDEYEGFDRLYHLDQFSDFVNARWFDPAFDNGPFVLSHGDLEMYSLLVNENLDILAVLDWEWSCVVPLQFFSPPTWIRNRPIATLSWGIFYNDYIAELDGFRAIVRERELETYGGELLSRDRASVRRDGGILICSALDNWTDVDYVAGRYLNRLLHQGKSLRGRIQQFMEEDPSRGELVARKVAYYMQYRAERKHLGIGDSEDERKEKAERNKAITSENRETNGNAKGANAQAISVQEKVNGL